MGRGIITASRTACLRAEHEVASRGEKCARLFSVGSEIAKNRFRDPGHSLPDALPRSVYAASRARPGWDLPRAVCSTRYRSSVQQRAAEEVPLYMYRVYMNI